SYAKRRTPFRIVLFGLKDNRLELIIEAGSTETIQRGLRAIGIWIGRRINEALGRSGRVFVDRYKMYTPTTPAEMRNAMLSVLGGYPPTQPADGGSSAPWSTGWASPPAEPEEPSPVAPARTWLASEGWRQDGPLAFGEKPRS